MIVYSDNDKHKEVSFEGDDLKIFKAERIPDKFLKENQILRESGQFHWMDKEKEWHHVARIPKIVINRLYKEYPEEMREPGNKFLYEWLDKPENQIWKTFGGNLA